MEREVNFKGVKFRLKAELVSSGSWEAKVLDCPGSEAVGGMNAVSALTLCEVRLESYVQASVRSAHQLRVDKMMRLIGAKRGEQKDGQRVPIAVVRDLSVEGRKLRAALMLEEVLETIAAMGLEVQVADGLHEIDVDLSVATFRESGMMDLVGVVDGCYDVRVVTTGTLSALGIPDEPGQELVDLNNLAKFGEGSSVRADGKLIKPAGHKPPDIAGWLESLPKEP